MASATNILARDLVPGDVLDLSNNPYARCAEHDGCDTAFEFEYAVVESVVQETPECTVVYTDLATFGCPPDSTVIRVSHQPQED